MSNRVTISIVTATFNAKEHLPALVESLRNQTDRDFEWVVADGKSTDGTVEYLQGLKDLDLVVTSENDFGVYDALNRGIRHATGDYYIVIGADDTFEHDAIENYRKQIIKSDADIVTAKVKSEYGLLEVKRGKAWLYGSKAFVSGHSVGAAFRKQLHERFGYYSPRFVILGDDYFMQKACRGGASVHVADFIAGEFTASGLSNTDIVGTLAEAYRIQLIFEKNKFLQTVIFLLRLLKNYRRL